MKDLENIFVAEVIEGSADGHTLRCRVGEAELVVATALRPAGGRITLTVHASDIILARNRPQQISARNILPATVIRVEGAGALLIAFVDVGAEWMVELTPQAVDELGIAAEKVLAPLPTGRREVRLADRHP